MNKRVIIIALGASVLVGLGAMKLMSNKKPAILLLIASIVYIVKGTNNPINITVNK